MNTKIFKGYFFIILSGIVLLAAAILIILQWDRVAMFSIYGSQEMPVNTALLILASAACGVVGVFLIKMLFHGIGSLRRGLREKARKSIDQRLRDTEKKLADVPKPPEQ